MKWMSGRKLIGVVGGMLGVLYMVPSVSAGSHKDFPEKYSDVYMPVSLAVGTVRTPEFPVVVQAYDILIQAQRSLPINQMQCMMGATSNPFESKNCTSDDPLLQAEWTVWDGAHVVAHGSSAPSGGSSIAKEQIWKSLGGFAGEAGKKYVVEVKFTKDGTPLNVADPRLIVIQHKKFW
jgi:hypothetical protein